jgi:hypothetical protein
VKKDYPTAQYEILFKHPDDSLSPAILHFGQGWYCSDPEGKKNLGDRQFAFADVDEVVVRARPQHLDVRFKGPRDKGNRIRLYTSELQLICNEFFCRCLAMLSTPCKVVFESGVRRFEFGAGAVCRGDPNNVRDRLQLNREKALAMLKAKQASKHQTSTLISDAESRSQMQEVERDIDEASVLIGEMKSQAEAMGPEIQRSTEQLRRIDNKAEHAQARIDRDNKRINKVSFLALRRFAHKLLTSLLCRRLRITNGPAAQ